VLTRRVPKTATRTLLIALLIALLVACATPQPPAPEPRDDPAAEPDGPPPQAEAPAPATLTIDVTPVDAVIRIGDQRPESGQPLVLPAGTYQLTVTHDGYLPQDRVLRLSPGQTLSTEISLDIEPPTHATVRINVTPADAEIRIGRQRLTGGEPVSIEPGNQELVVNREGYFSHRERIELAAGDLRSLDVNLEPIPKAGSLRIQAHHPDATILLDDEEIGRGDVNLEEVRFGAYRLASVRMLDSWRREKSEIEIRFERNGQDSFTLQEDIEQWRWQGEWIDASDARAREQRAYRQLRVPDPVLVSAEVSAAVLARILRLDEADRWFFDQLRPGDRLQLISDQHRWLLWRRGNQPDPAFLDTVAAMRTGKAYALPWSADDDDPRPVSARVERPAQLSFFLASARGQSPLVDLPAEALAAWPGGQLIVHHAQSDGTLLLLAEGGDSLSLGEVNLAPDPLGDFRRLLSAADGQAVIAWQDPPERLMIMPDRGPRLAAPEPVELLTGEKHLATIALEEPPVRVMQFTFGPDSERTGVWEEFSAAAGPGQALDLRQLDLGPNLTDGHYQRIWLLIYDSATGRTQRQISGRYHIGVERLDTEGAIFLRRQPGEELDGG